MGPRARRLRTRRHTQEGRKQRGVLSFDEQRANQSFGRPVVVDARDAQAQVVGHGLAAAARLLPHRELEPIPAQIDAVVAARGGLTEDYGAREVHQRVPGADQRDIGAAGVEGHLLAVGVEDGGARGCTGPLATHVAHVVDRRGGTRRTYLARRERMETQGRDGTTV